MSTEVSRPGQYEAVTTSIARLVRAGGDTRDNDADPKTDRDASPVAEPDPLPSLQSAEARESHSEPSSGQTFDALYEAHFDFVWRSARRLGVPVGSADDVVQDTFVVLHRHLSSYDGKTPLRSWIFGILRRVVGDHRRRYRRKDAACVPHPEESERAIASSAPPPSAEAERSEALALLETLLSELDENKRELLVLAELEEMTVPEIAALLGLNVNTAYARLRAARRDFEAAHARHQARATNAANRATSRKAP